MSEAWTRRMTRPTALDHAGEVAHWAVMLTGWLWLGEQGMRLGWSLASGVLAVTLWWAVRIVCRGHKWALQAGPVRMGVCGLLTAWGVWLPVWMPDTPSAHAALLGLAVVWGVWSGLIESRSQTSTFRLGSLAWHPLLAAALLLAVWWMSEQTLATPLASSGMLAGCAVLLHVRERRSAVRTVPCKANAVLGVQLLAPSAMGLMMGALWLGDAWCAGLGWTPTQMVWAHLGLMVGLPALVALCLRLLPHGPALSAHHTSIEAGLMALGALMMLGDTAIHDVSVMLLPSLAWALHCVRHTMARPAPKAQAVVWSVWAQRGLSLLLGPGLLLGVGLASPSLGPVAMQAALAALGGLALLWLLFGVWLAHVPRKSWPAATLP